MKDIKEVNLIKKHLGVKKRELILLGVYLKYGVEIEDVDEACEYVLKKINLQKL